MWPKCRKLTAQCLQTIIIIVPTDPIDVICASDLPKWTWGSAGTPPHPGATTWFVFLDAYLQNPFAADFAYSEILIISYMIPKIFYLHNTLTFKIHVCSLGNPSGCLYWHTARIKVHYIRLWSMKNVNTMTSFKNQIKMYVCKNDFLMVDRVLRRQCGSPIRLLSFSYS